MELNRTIQGDAATVLATLPDGCVHCCISSPPYWGLRDYGMAGQIGLEATLSGYLERLMAVMAEVRRVLRDDGTLWLNIGDAYAGSASTGGGGSFQKSNNPGSFFDGKPKSEIPAKNLIGLPWRVAFALQDAGWILRSDIIWCKPSPMPESVRDRPTRAHEYVFLLSKAERYHYDADAVRQPMLESSRRRLAQESFWRQEGGAKDYGPDSNRSMRRTLENLRGKIDKQRGHERPHNGFNGRWDGMTKAEQQAMGANLRDVWQIASKPFTGWRNGKSHFATFPEALVERCIAAGTSEGGCCSACGAPRRRVHGSEWTPSCSCLHCATCATVIECQHVKNHKTQANVSVRGSVSREHVQDVLVGNRSRSRAGVRVVREEVQGSQEEQGGEEQILLQGLCGSVVGEESVINQGVRDSERVQAPAPARASDGCEDGVHHGASVRHGTTTGPTPAEDGGRPSSEREEDGQQARESCGDGQAGSRPPSESSVRGNLSVLQGEVPAPWKCPKCDGVLTVPDTEPCVVLDCFHGSGTVGLVARKLDRNYLGVELNPEYVRMADERIANDGRAGTLPLFG